MDLSDDEAERTLDALIRLGGTLEFKFEQPAKWLHHIREVQSGVVVAKMTRPHKGSPLHRRKKWHLAGVGRFATCARRYVKPSGSDAREELYNLLGEWGKANDTEISVYGATGRENRVI